MLQELKIIMNASSYKRPESGWWRLMGAPVIDVQDNVAFGVHVGINSLTDSNGDVKVAQGRTLKSLGVEELLRQAGITITRIKMEFSILRIK